MQDSDHWQELQALFDLADTAAPEERERVLTQTGANPEIRQRVLALLQAAEPERATDSYHPPIGPYTVLKLIGSGGVGSVYLAERTLDGILQQVALKVLAPHAAGPGFVDRFARERRILASLENPGITRLLDAGLSADGHPYMVMEYVEGLHLDDYCTANSLDLFARLRLFQKICAVVDYAHSKSVVHLDLKPSNILVTREGDVKLLDFGTSKLLSSDGTFTATVMATPAYASPEQLRHEPVTTASDVYSLGVILFELLIGRRPLRDSKPLTAAERVGFMRNASVELSAILSKCLAEAPLERYTSASALSRDVAAFLGDLPVLARPGYWKAFLKAIGFKPARPRHPPVEELSKDLDRYLLELPAPDRRDSARFWTRIRRNPALAALAIVLTLVGALYWWHASESSARSAVSIAVLPFVNLSGDPADLYFSDGLTDEIAGELARFKKLRVTARASAFQFPSHNADVRDAGRQLGVTNILEGSVARSGNSVKVVARLQRVSDGSTIWTNTYDLTSADLLAAQSELAASIARNLNAAATLRPTTTSKGAPRHVPPAEAHDLYLRGMYEAEQLTAESLKRAEADFQRAIDLDPGYAAAYASMGSSVLNRRTARFRIQDHGEVRRASELLQKALDLDPEMSAARGALASIALTVDWDWTRAERELQIASASGPNAAVEGTYAVLMTYKGRFSEADEHLGRALDLDPLSVAQGMRAASIRTWEGRYAQAIEQCQRITTRYPKIIQPAIVGAAQQAAVSHADLALQTLNRMNHALPEVRIYKAMVLAYLGRIADAYALTVPFEKDFQDSDVPVEWFAIVHAIAGDDENAITWLERSADRREPQVLCIGVNPIFKRLRGYPRFRELKKRIGLEP